MGGFRSGQFILQHRVRRDGSDPEAGLGVNTKVHTTVISTSQGHIKRNQIQS